MEILSTSDTANTILVPWSSEFPLAERGEARGNLLALPDEVLLLVLEYLDVRSTAAFGSTCWRIWRLKGELGYYASNRDRALSRPEMLVQMKYFTEKMGCGPSKLRLFNPSFEMVSYASQRWASSLRVLSLDDWTANAFHCAAIPEHVKYLNFLQPLTSLRELKLKYHRERVATLEPLSYLVQLRKLELGGFNGVVYGTGLRFGLTSSLQELSLLRFEALRDLCDLVALTSLRSLNIEVCGALEETSVLREMTWLKKLRIVGCCRIRCADDLFVIPGLVSLSVSWLHSGCRLTTSSGLPSLRKLSLISHKNRSYNGQSLIPMVFMERLRTMPLLRKLKVPYEQYRRLMLRTMPLLRTLHISGYGGGDVHLDVLTRVPNLRKLKLSRCNAANAEWMHGLKSLEKLSLVYIVGFHISSSSQLLQVKRLFIKGDTDAIFQANFCPFSEVQVMELTHNGSIADLADLPILTHLQFLSLAVCPNLQYDPEIKRYENLPSLKWVQVDGRINEMK